MPLTGAPPALFDNLDIIMHNDGANYSTTSTTFVDVDTTDLSITLTTQGGPVLVAFTAHVHTANAGSYVALDLTQDAVRIGAANALGLLVQSFDAAWINFPITWVGLIPTLTAGTHTFTLQWLVSAGTSYILSRTQETPVTLCALELKA